MLLTVMDLECGGIPIDVDRRTDEHAIHGSRRPLWGPNAHLPNFKSPRSIPCRVSAREFELSGYLSISRTHKMFMSGTVAAEQDCSARARSHGEQRPCRPRAQMRGAGTNIINTDVHTALVSQKTAIALRPQRAPVFQGSHAQRATIRHRSITFATSTRHDLQLPRWIATKSATMRASLRGPSSVLVVREHVLRSAERLRAMIGESVLRSAPRGPGATGRADRQKRHCSYDRDTQNTRARKDTSAC